MKNTLWVFGDSYTQDLSIERLCGLDHSTKDFFAFHDKLAWVLDGWPFKLASNLKMEIKNFGITGSSLEYSAQKYTENFSNFVDGDVVIFAITQLSRKYLIDSKPSWSNPCRIDDKMRKSGYTENDIYFYRRAFTENGLRPNETILRLLLHSSAILTNRDIKVVFIPCFPDAETRLHDHRELFPGSINETTGNLYANISKLEITEPFRQKASNSVIDFRLNHMHKLNHDILINKLTECIINKIPLDLVNGFEQEIFDEIPKKETNGFTDYQDKQ